MTTVQMNLNRFTITGKTHISDACIVNRRSAPTFAVKFWNMQSRVADGLPRTNNSVEGWHHAFQSAVPPSTNFCNSCRRSKTILNSNSHDSRLVTRMQEAARTNMHKSHDVYSHCCQLMEPDRFLTICEE